MEKEPHNILPEGFDPQRVGYLLDSAVLAEQGGNSRLAIHLYCAAFEASQDSDDGVDERALSGLRQAWMLACRQGDRSTAETIFNDLAPYNSDEQTQAALVELQDMAIEQLGMKREEVESLAEAFMSEVRDAGIDVKALSERFSSLRNPGITSERFGHIIDSLKRSLNPADFLAPEGQGAPEGGAAATGTDEVFPELHYGDLVGFEKTKEKMRIFGIVDPRDTEMNSFLQQAESFHGFSGPVLTQNFHFTGTSREDCGIFAQATANEIGWPVITMIVDVNEMHDGTIKVIAPVKRSFFGPPRLSDLPNHCTLVIQNIDILQDLFWSEEQTISKGQGPFGFRHADERSRLSGSSQHPGIPMGTGIPGIPGFQQHSLQSEILGYLHALFSRGGVFVIATSALPSEEEPLVLSEQLENLLGIPVEISVDKPITKERQQVLTAFSEDHPSFNDLDMATLANLSEGMSRYEIMVSCRQAVELAYRESLKNQRHQMVSLEDILTQFTHHLAQDSEAYRLIEDYLVALFTAGLETDFLHSEIIPNQISLNFEESDSDSDSDEKGTLYS